MTAWSAITGEEKSFRETNPFALGKGEKTLISVRNSAWENLATETKDPLKQRAGIGLARMYRPHLSLLALARSPGGLASKRPVPARQDLPVSAQEKQLHSHSV